MLALISMTNSYTEKKSFFYVNRREQGQRETFL